MTREEQIHEAATNAESYDSDERLYSFTDGARWADEHPKSPWISVKERLPEIGETCLVAIKQINMVFLASYWNVKRGWEEENTRDKIVNVTHWMPIPKFEEE